MTKRDTYKYELKDGNTVVYVGTTSNPLKREQKHRSEGKIFGHLKIVGRISTKTGAENWQEKRLETYRTFHDGFNPKYNRTINGK
jgi:hypothetical protein